MREWTEQIHHLSTFASSQPHAAYAAFTHGLAGRWTYLLRTVQDISPLLRPLDDAIHQQFLPALTGRPPCSPEERELLSLPVRLGGLGINDPTTSAYTEYVTSTQISAPPVALIIAQENNYSIDQRELRKIKADTHALKHKKHRESQGAEENLQTMEKAGSQSSQSRNTDSVCTRGHSTTFFASDMPGRSHDYLRHVHAGTNLMSTMP